MTHGISDYVPPDKVQVQAAVTLTNLLAITRRTTRGPVPRCSSGRRASRSRRSVRAPPRHAPAGREHLTRSVGSSRRATARKLWVEFSDPGRAKPIAHRPRPYGQDAQRRVRWLSHRHIRGHHDRAPDSHRGRRLPLHRLARPSAVLAFALPFAYVGGLGWLIWLHIVEGGHERNEPSLLVHGLRDGTVALPLIAVAVWVGIVLGRRLITRWGAQDSPVLAAGVLAVSVALAASVAQGLTNPAHASLFGAHHGGHEPSCSCTCCVTAGSRSSPTRSSRPSSAPPSCARSPGPSRTSTLARPEKRGARYALPASSRCCSSRRWRSWASTARGPATAGNGLPCPAQAPREALRRARHRRRHPAQPLRRSRPERQDVRALRPGRRPSAPRSASRQVSIGLRDDPIQPLVIRANEGDCVEINFTQQRRPAATTASTSTASPSTPTPRATRSATNVLGRRPAAPVAHVPLLGARDTQLEGAHYLRPGPGYRAGVAHGLFGALVGRARRLDVPRHDDRRADRVRLGGDIMPGAARRSARTCSSTTRSATRSTTSRTTDGRSCLPTSTRSPRPTAPAPVR